MRPSTAPPELAGLICEGGFPDERSLLSFAMSLGVFHGKRKEPEGSTNLIDVQELESYPLCVLVITDGGRSDMEPSRVREVLAEHLHAGLSMMKVEVDRSRGTRALRRIASLLPK
ncbi:MAG TPA: hypothetical protein ENK47_09125 [Euryarchaeota archaeon]|nr:MAG: hypothetical protein B6U90_06400 [Thermoplasmatales archaeon ex4484_6]RLF67730.1 MAG: hypothetical protein DRN57_05335 [Thermoplasmata archaeon]HHD16857.1 hypothetical protein [Euryarchaeota archaeon]